MAPLLDTECHIMPKLTETQAILLSTAAQRTDGSLLPLPDRFRTLTVRIRKAMETLVNRRFAQEIPVAVPAHIWRNDDDLHWGLVITDAGRQAVGKEAPEMSSDPKGPSSQRADLADQPVMQHAKEHPTKKALVLNLLSRQQGATLAELIDATGWLPHTIRASLTGLRKKGHNLSKGKRGEVTCYTVAKAA